MAKTRARSSDGTAQRARDQERPAGRAARAKAPSTGAFGRLRRLAPEVVKAYEALTAAASQAGPLSVREVALVKLAASIGRGASRTAHAHTRKALEAGVDPGSLRHVAIVALATVGLPAALDGLRWVDETIAEQ